MVRLVLFCLGALLLLLRFTDWFPAWSIVHAVIVLIPSTFMFIWVAVPPVSLSFVIVVSAIWFLPVILYFIAYIPDVMSVPPVIVATVFSVQYVPVESVRVLGVIVMLGWFGFPVSIFIVLVVILFPVPGFPFTSTAHTFSVYVPSLLPAVPVVNGMFSPVFSSPVFSVIFVPFFSKLYDRLAAAVMFATAESCTLIVSVLFVHSLFPSSPPPAFVIVTVGAFSSPAVLFIIVWSDFCPAGSVAHIFIVYGVIAFSPVTFHVPSLFLFSLIVGCPGDVISPS